MNSRLDVYNKAHELALEHEPELQSLIDSGTAWRLEGSYGRAAMESLESGVGVLPDTSHSDYYDNKVPAYHELSAGSKGTPELTIKYYAK